jgi:lipoate---protein ligase
LLDAEAGSGAETLRLWEWPAPAVVLGAAGVLATEVNVAACTALGVPILRRSSGGGTVVLGPGCLLYSLILRYDRAPELAQIGCSYCYLLDCICRHLKVDGLQPAGTSDLALGPHKVSGNAQQRKRHHLLHHGSLLFAFDAAQVERYLFMPIRQPEYRHQRAHVDFLANLPLDRATLTLRLREAFAADREVVDWPANLVAELVQTKYGQTAWTRRR